MNTTPHAFTLFEGTPTVTFVKGKAHRMLPYHAFTDGQYDENIVLRFGDLSVTIEGESMDELWQGIQLQDVREVRVHTLDMRTGDCCINAITFFERPNHDVLR